MGDYAAFHKQWTNWKLEHGDTKEQIDINLSILLDWMDECLLFYANSIKTFNIPGYTWISVFPAEEIMFPAYETKLGILQDEEIKANLAHDQKQLEEAVRKGNENPATAINPEKKNQNCSLM